MEKKILEVKNLQQYFKLPEKGIQRAVEHVSFDLYEGEKFGLVGESGSGKTTIARSILGMLKPTGGEILFEGNSVTNKKNYQKKRMYFCQNMQMIFQDPASSLNPRMTVEQIMMEPLRIQKGKENKKEQKQEVERMLEMVGIDSLYKKAFPEELSGGQKQRICIARALLLHPKLIVADEPIASLDVSIKAQIMNLFVQLQKELTFTLLFISHDLAAIGQFCDRIGVMSKGKLVELDRTEEIFENPKDPYTKALLEAMPDIYSNGLFNGDKK